MLTVDQTAYEADWLSSWAGEQILWEMERQSDLPGSLTEMALSDTRREQQQGGDRPSSLWSAQWGLALGLRRLLVNPQVQLLDGTQLAEHQIEVLEAVLSAETERIIDQPSGPAADPNRIRRYWIEQATGSGKTIAALALADAARSGRVLILTSRRSLVDQFENEFRARGYAERLRELKEPLHPQAITVTTYQYWNRIWHEFDPHTFSLVICDEVHGALGPTTSSAVKALEDVTIVGMTATGELLDKSVQELFPRQLSSFSLRKATQLGVISPLRALRVPPAFDLDTLQGVARRGGDYDQAALAELLNRDPFNHAAARLYRDMFAHLPGVIYAAGIEHSQALASALLAVGVGAVAVSGKTSGAVLSKVLSDYNDGKIRVIVNANLLAEGWNSPRATVCMHLAPTASRRVYQQRVGRVTRLWPEKNSGLIVDFVSPEYPNDGRVITLHSLLDERLYTPGAAVTVGPLGPPPEMEPAIAWHPLTVAVVAAEADQRTEAVAEAWRQLDPAQMNEADRAQWATAAGAAASTPANLKDILRRLQPWPHQQQRCLQIALDSANSDIKNMAADRLEAHPGEDGEGWKMLVEAALRADNVAWQRALVDRVFRSALRGEVNSLDQAQALLLSVAGLDRMLYERASGLRPFPQQPDQIRAAVALIDHRSAPQAAAALAAMPQEGDIGELVKVAANRMWPTPSALAEALLKAR
jgi:ribonuclease E